VTEQSTHNPMFKGSNIAESLSELLTLAVREKAKRVNIQESCPKHCLGQILCKNIPISLSIVYQIIWS
jgi:hypothetical protein